MPALVVVRVVGSSERDGGVPTGTFVDAASTLSPGADFSVVELTATHEELGEIAVRALGESNGGVLAVEYHANALQRLAGFCGQIASVLDEAGNLCSGVILRVASLDGLLDSHLTEHLSDRARAAGEVPVLVADGRRQARLLDGQLEEAEDSRLVALPRTRPKSRTPTVCDVDLAFGHFRVDGDDPAPLHLNVLPRLDRFVGDLTLVHAVAETARELAGEDEFLVSYVGSSLLELQRLAIEITGGEVARVVEADAETRAPENPRSVVLISDVVGPKLTRQGTVRALNRRGWPEVSVLGITGLPGAQEHSLVRLAEIAGAFTSWACPYCRQGTPLADGPAHLSVAQFHSKEFWDLLSWDDRFTLVGHWPSPTTPNHFNLRISGGAVFEVFGRSIAERMRNSLVRRGVLPAWLDGMICTTGDERDVLVDELADLLGIPSENVLGVPSHVRSAASGPGLRDEVRAWVNGDAAETAARLRGKNLLLVDQAAHHFHTVAALRKVASVVDARCLAFCVFVDRSGFPEEMQGALAGLHYLPLYTWPSPPSQSGLCPCGQVGAQE